MGTSVAGGVYNVSNTLIFHNMIDWLTEAMNEA